MDGFPGNIKEILVDIDREIKREELTHLVFLCRKDHCDDQSGHCSLDEVDFCITMRHSENIDKVVGILSKAEREKIHTALDLFCKLRETLGRNFQSLYFLKLVIYLLRCIHREDLVRKLMPFYTWSCPNSPAISRQGSRRPSLSQHLTEVSDLDSKFLHSDGVDLYEAKRVLDELVLRNPIAEEPIQEQNGNRHVYLAGNFPTPALVFFVFVFMMPTFSSMIYIYDNYVLPPVAVQRDHTDTPLETKKELMGQPVLYGLTRPEFKNYQDLSLHAQNVRLCLSRHKRCLIKGFFGEGKSQTLSMYIHESIGKYPAGIIWLREWKDIVAVADVIASHRGTDIVIRKEAAAAYLQDFLWNSSGWLLTIQDVHLWDTKDFKRVVNLFSNLESDINHVILTSHTIPEVLHDSIKVYEFNAGVHVNPDSCHSMIDELLSNSISLKTEEKERLLPIWQTTSCNQYAIKRIANFINEWNFTIEGFVSHWNVLTKHEWLEILGFGQKSEALFTEMKILTDLQEQHPRVINFILDYIRTGKVKYEIPNCKLHERYRGESLLFILSQLKDHALADVVIDGNENLCSVQMPALLRLLIEVTFLLKEDRVDRMIGEG